MLNLILHSSRGPLRSRESLILENVSLCHQLHVLSRGRKRPALKNRDRMVWIFLRRSWQDWRKPLVIVQPETVIRGQELRPFSRSRILVNPNEEQITTCAIAVGQGYGAAK